MPKTNNQHAFSEEEKRGVYRAIHERRDIRSEFLPDEIPSDVLMKILHAAHHAGSVGFMQPWDFIIIDDKDIKKKVKDIFVVENEKAKGNYEGKKKEMYSSFKLEGIESSPINICITCDTERGGEHVIGRNSIKEMDVYSVCCAVQNIWLAARAEDIGVGWVSILNNKILKTVLDIPEHVIPVAYLCMGYVSEFAEKPLLETAGWRKRLPLEELISWNKWMSRP